MNNTVTVKMKVITVDGKCLSKHIKLQYLPRHGERIRDFHVDLEETIEVAVTTVIHSVHCIVLNVRPMSYENDEDRSEHYLKHGWRMEAIK